MFGDDDLERLINKQNDAVHQTSELQQLQTFLQR
jgi:hypothetical protein